ncbi:MAG: 4'-phosphopantetheinyl transferase superfamily protein [Elusimicrobiota bacterium]|jgi:4'-phosphopantetheinyl transferase|nr:4'-phosphopantetheinyl transferase superfamily protein [Elusimicrobiota bacterium]
MAYRYKVVELAKLPAADTILTAGELAVYQDFKIEKRRKEWLGGRYALKSLAMDFFTFNMKQMEVKNSSSGQPRLLVPGGTHLPVSITHSGIWASAAIALTGEAIGIDIEVVEKRSKAWAEECFHKDEISSKAAVFLTELWVKKEAVLKFLGVGLSINMQNIRFVNGNLELHGKALDLWAKIGSPKIQIDVEDLDGGYKLAVASQAPLL